MFLSPHRYFYPLDFSNNLQNIWMGPSYGNQSSSFGFGYRSFLREAAASLEVHVEASRR